MSYQVLARKWRPRQFSELVGQQHVKTALANALTNSRLHHAYLFTGTRGVGKTTIARIFAKSLNCEEGITASPCGKCSACLEIDAGNFVDLLEIDAASRTKVEDTRDLLDNVQYAPSRGRFKVYLIDEVHMLSRHSFNALLKTLEEPPPHVKFLLATTDPQKLPITVLSRCLQFSLKALTPQQIEQHLADVLTKEQISFEPAALSLLAKAAKGSLRDSLSLTDQAIALSNSALTVEPIRQMLGLLDSSWAVRLLTALLAADLPTLQQTLQDLLSQQSDYAQVLDDMLSLLHLIALTQLQPAAAELSEQAAVVRQFAATLPAEDVQLYYQLLLSGKKELPYAPEPVIGLEMALLRALAFVPASRPPSNAAAPSREAAPYVAPSTASPSAGASVTPTATAASVTSSLPEPLAEPLTAQPLTEKPTAADSQVSVGQTVAPATTASADTNAPQPGGSAPAIDPVTARIMQRRGVQVTAATERAPEKKSERLTAPSNQNTLHSKPEHRASAATSDTLANLPTASTVVNSAPATEPHVKVARKPATAAPTLENAAAPVSAHFDSSPAEYGEESTSDDTVSFAEQQALTEAWWQQQQFDTLPTPDTAELDEQRFSIRFAAQVDAWARLIEQLPIGGLMRLYLLHSAMQQQGLAVTLTVAQSQQHLDTADFRQKLKAAISPVFPADFTLDIRYQAEVTESPLAIQQRIEQERKEYVSRLLQQDPHVQSIQQLFAAELQLDTLQVN